MVETPGGSRKKLLTQFMQAYHGKSHGLHLLRRAAVMHPPGAEAAALQKHIFRF